MPGFSRISHYIPLSFITKVKFILSSVYMGVKFSSVNQTSMYENSERNICVNMIVGEIFNS